VSRDGLLLRERTRSPRQVAETDQQAGAKNKKAVRQEAHVFNFYSIMKRVAAITALGAMLIAGSLQPAHAQAPAAAKPAKEWAAGEFQLYEPAQKALAANKFADAIAALDAWKQKNPTSAFGDDRAVMYIQAYSGAKQFDKALAEAGPMLSKDLDAAFPDPKGGPSQVLAVLFTSAVAIQNIPQPTPEQFATAEKAAKMLQTYNRKPEGLDDAAWNTAKSQLQNAAKGALVYIAYNPGINALAKNDCETAQTALSKALRDFPDNAFISFNLGQAYMCTVRKTPAKNDEVRPKAIYAFIRTLMIDPSAGGTQDGKKMADVLPNTYINFHGGADGLDELKQQAKASPLPPDNFTIESATKVAERKQKEFETKYPQLAMWLGIKGQLAGAGGPQYFESSLKNAAVPKLKGNVVEGKPACRSKELLISVPEPDQQNAAAVITLRLDAALTGKPEAGEIEWEGVPSAFTADPFMLTMDTEKAKIENLKTTPCAAAPAHPGVKKSAPKKK
jgi:hypothetical protein